MSAPIPEDRESRLALWANAACGRHANRYCEDDGGWDSICRYCADNYEREKRIAALEAKLAALEWKPITADNLPKVGDEVLRFIAPNVPFVREVLAVWGTQQGWTHFRAINPPEAAHEEAR